jgi:ubiquinone/menaquinone biosynthesis C-methylase UbiE
MILNPTTAIIETFQKMAAHPWVYDRIQTLAGQGQNLDRISRQTAAMRVETVVDVGGGTGASRKLWPVGCRYVCLDIEMPKLKGFRSKVPSGLAVLSDATRMSIATESADVVMCMAVAHHLTDPMLDQVFEEALRVLRVGGRLILLDPVLNRELLMGRILWRLDRGSYPRTAEELREKMEGRFKIVHWEKFAIYHEYVFGIGVRPSIVLNKVPSPSEDCIAQRSERPLGE